MTREYISIFEHKMTTLTGETAITTNKFNTQNFNLQNFKFEIELASAYLWHIVDKYKKTQTNVF